jgi:16S rRNA (adenine1518-N6/adenine1519-N6)-dimethyltransferase
MGNIKPLKRFGQNYLKDRNIVEKIVREIAPVPEDKIIEIGPGLGILTREIFQYNNNLVAVEIDNRVVNTLKESLPQLNLINQDFLKLDLSTVFKINSGGIKIIGNIPYNLTSSILFKLIDYCEIINDAVFMVQYEVARRMTANKGTKDYGILSIVLDYFSNINLCFKVSPNVFFPKPKVFSAVVHIQFKKDLNDRLFNKLFVSVVKSCFGNRRKTLKNSLNNSIFRTINFEGCGIDLSLRAEQLDTIDFIDLTKFVQKELYIKEN